MKLFQKVFGREERVRLPHIVVIDEATRVKFNYDDVFVAPLGPVPMPYTRQVSVDMYLALDQQNDDFPRKEVCKPIRHCLDDPKINVYLTDEQRKNVDDSNHLRNLKIHATYRIFDWLPRVHEEQHIFHKGIEISPEIVRWEDFLKTFEYVFEATGYMPWELEKIRELERILDGDDTLRVAELDL